jgi:hypothetical protein
VVAPGEQVSGLEDEYLLSGNKPRLIYVKAAAERFARSVPAAGPAELDGVSFIDLAAVLDAAGWPEAVTAVLGIRPEGTRPVLDLLIDRLQGRRLLLVLDNVEQLVAAASDLGTLLAACPDLTVLVTSRIVLRLRGEHEMALAPLPTPQTGCGPMPRPSGGQPPCVYWSTAPGRYARTSP